MARYYLAEKNEPKEETKGVITGGGIAKGNDPDRPDMLAVPLGLCPVDRNGRPIQQHVPLKKGGICVTFGRRFQHVGPGEYVDLPDDLPVRVVKSRASQLLTKEEALEAGLCNPDGTLKQKAAKPSKKEDVTNV